MLPCGSDREDRHASIRNIIRDPLIGWQVAIADKEEQQDFAYEHHDGAREVLVLAHFLLLTTEFVFDWAIQCRKLHLSGENRQ